MTNATRIRRLAASLALTLVAAQFALLDAAERGAAGWFARPGTFVDAASSIALLLAVAVMARSRASRVVLATIAAAVLVLQILVFRYFHAPLDVQIVASALHDKREVRPVLMRVLPGYLAAVVLVAAAQLALLSFARRTLDTTGRLHPRLVDRRLVDPALHAVLAVAALGGLFGAGPRHATPEVRAVHALTALAIRHEPVVATAVALPPLHVDRREIPDVLFVLTESVRALDYRPSGDTPTAPETAALTPGRTDLAQLRAVSSYTALSLSAILTGRSQEGPREAILRAPSLFDFAHAARDARGARPFVSYYSSQPSTVFETDGVRAAVDRFVTIETLRGHDVEDDADYADLPLDRDIVDRFVEELPALRSPTFAMLHLVGTHAPYFLDPRRSPFDPYDHVVTWSGMPKLLNAYRDSIYEQDRTMARAVRAFMERANAARRPWLVVFTSDHGEAFGEHGAIHHGQNLMDEQVHVPGFIAAGGEALRADQLRALGDHGGRFVTHLDLLPTLLDAMGLWDNFSVAQHRAAMTGRSLLRDYEPRGPIPVTNCTGMFQCPLNTWGLFEADRKLLARTWDGGWYCTAVDGPPGSERVVDHPDPACDRLRAVSRTTFPLLPNGAPNR